jgi:hypothetical protein
MFCSRASRREKAIIIMAMENSLKSSKSFSRELNGYKFKMFEGGGGIFVFCRKQIFECERFCGAQ